MAGWLWKVQAPNQERQYAEPAAMLRCVAERWFLTCCLNPDKQTNSFAEYRRQALARHFKPSAKLYGKFMLKNFVLRHL